MKRIEQKNKRSSRINAENAETQSKKDSLATDETRIDHGYIYNVVIATSSYYQCFIRAESVALIPVFLMGGFLINIFSAISLCPQRALR